jgi:hypothetical protein
MAVMVDNQDVKLTAHKMQAWVHVNLDDDGTPLDQHGERMVEIEPGQWVESLIAQAMGLFAQFDEQTLD